MKKIFFIFFVMFLVALSMSSSTKADPPLMGAPAQDGSRLAVYTQLVNGNQTSYTFYPRDSNKLGLDNFYLWVSFPPVQYPNGTLIKNPRPAMISLTMYALEWTVHSSYDNLTGKNIVTNTSAYTKVVSSITVSIYAGQNEAGDPSYGIKYVDQNVWGALAPSDALTKIHIQYENVPIDIYHKTDYSQVPITQTRGQFNMQLYQQIGMYTFFLFAVLLALIYGINKSGKASPPLSLGWGFGIIGFLIAIYTYSFYTSYYGASGGTNYVYTLAGLRPENVMFILATISDFFIVGITGHKNVYEVDIIALRTPYTDSAEVINQTMTLERKKQIEKSAQNRRITIYSYKTLRNTTVFTYDKDSFWQWWLDLLGGVKFNANELTSVYKMDKDWKNVIGMTYFTFDFKEKTRSLIPDEFSLIFTLGVFGSIIGLLLLTIYLHLPVLGGSVYTIIVLSLWYINHTLERQKIEVIPMTLTGIAALTLANVADVSQLRYDNILSKYTDLLNRKDNILTESVNTARQETWQLSSHYARQYEYGSELPRVYERLALNFNYDPTTNLFTRKETEIKGEVDKPKQLDDNKPKEPKKSLRSRIRNGLSR